MTATTPFRRFDLSVTSARRERRRLRPAGRNRHLRIERLEDRRLLASFRPEIEVRTSSGILVNDGTTTVDFGAVIQGLAPATRSFVVFNRGTFPLHLGSVTLPDGFRLVEGLTPRLLPGTSDSMTVRLESVAAGSKSGQLSFANNDLDENPFNFAVSGRVLPASAPEIEVRSLNGALVTDGVTTIDFGTVNQGQPGPERTLVVRNLGNVDLTLGSLSLPTGYRIVDGLTTRLVPGAADLLTIRMESLTAGLKTGQLFFTNNDPDENPFNVNLRGQVVAVPQPEIEVRLSNGIVLQDGTSSVHFGSVQQGVFLGPSVTFTVWNRGTADLTLATPTVPAGFRLIEGLLPRLSPGRSDSFTVRLDTSVAGLKTGTLSFATNDLDENPFNFAITGNVVPRLGRFSLPTSSVTSSSTRATPLAAAALPPGPSNAGQPAIGLPLPSRWMDQRLAGYRPPVSAANDFGADLLRFADADDVLDAISADVARAYRVA